MIDKKIKLARLSVVAIGLAFGVFNILVMCFYDWKVPVYLLIVMFLYNFQKYFVRHLVRLRKLKSLDDLIDLVSSDPANASAENLATVKILIKEIKELTDDERISRLY